MHQVNQSILDSIQRLIDRIPTTLKQDLLSPQYYSSAVATTHEPQELKSIAPPFAGLTGLTVLIWIILAIFRSLDDDRYYFTIAMILAGVLAAYQLRHSRVNRNPIEGGTVAFYVIIWLAIFTFTDRSTEVMYQNYSLTLKQLEFIALLPLVIIWFLPFNQEKFFGLLELERSDKLHAIWRSSVVFMIIVNILNQSIELDRDWIWRVLEFFILIPMIYETVQLQRLSKEKLPVLTLFIQTEMAEKFAVPFSILKSVFLIMVAFLFEILDSRLWLLVILGYFSAGMMWALFSLVPEEMRGDDQKSEEFADDIRKFFGADETKSRRDRRKRKSRDKKKQVLDDISSVVEVEPTVERSTKIQPSNTALATTTSSLATSGQTVPDGSIQQKAHALGQRVRSGIEKPIYTLNHILSTLKAEDFSHAWRVDVSNLQLPSTRGTWNPTKGLILFPVELEKYDYRRTDQILLLGFNRPIQSKEEGLQFQIDSTKKTKARITENAIRFGDVEFNTRSLIVTREQWEVIKPKLSVVTQDDDISHTGFTTLQQMQQVLASLSDKWLEVRFTAQEAAVNFLAGLLGASDPIFIPKEGLEAPSYPELQGKIVDTELIEEKPDSVNSDDDDE